MGIFGYETLRSKKCKQTTTMMTMMMLLTAALLMTFGAGVESFKLPCDTIAIVRQLNNSWIELDFCADAAAQRFVVFTENVGIKHYEYDHAREIKPTAVNRPEGQTGVNVLLQAPIDLQPDNEYRFFIMVYKKTDTRQPLSILFGQLFIDACELTECLRMDSLKFQCLTDEMLCNGKIECNDGEDEDDCGYEKARSVVKFSDQVDQGPCAFVDRTSEDFDRVIPPICSPDGWWSPIQCSHMEQYQVCECVDKQGDVISDPVYFMLGDNVKKELLQEESFFNENKWRSMTASKWNLNNNNNNNNNTASVPIVAHVTTPTNCTKITEAITSPTFCICKYISMTKFISINR